jgi:hypothetical protein
MLLACGVCLNKFNTHMQRCRSYIVFDENRIHSFDCVTIQWEVQDFLVRHLVCLVDD